MPRHSDQDGARMPPGASLASEDTKTIIERAAAVTGVAVSLHSFAGGTEGDCIAGCGGSHACAHVASLPWGRQHCRVSRSRAAVKALRRGRPEPFICHMGFACVAAPASSEPGAETVITFGPYCPIGTRDLRAPGAEKRISEISERSDAPLSCTLDDIPTLAPKAVYRAAEWTVKTLEARAMLIDASGPISCEPQEETRRIPNYRKRRYSRPVRDAYQAADIAAAIAAGDGTPVRSLVRGILAETEAGRRKLDAVRCARAVALVAAVIEAGERLGLDTATARAEFVATLDDAYAASDETALRRCAMKVLNALRREAAASKAAHYGFPELHRVIVERLSERLTLPQAAALIGVKPDALSKRLQRKAKMSYSVYVGRLRVDKAKDLLRNSRLSIKQIAFRVGFDDPGNFSKTFRRYEDHTPTQYRDRFGKL